MTGIKENIIRITRYISVSLLILCITPLCDRDVMISGARSINPYTGQENTCTIDLGDDMYGPHGLETGFNYELLCRFAEHNHCNVRILPADRRADYLDSLQQGRIDIVITHHADSLKMDGISILKKVNSCSSWVIRTTDRNKVRQMNTWISYMTSSPEFQKLHKRFNCLFNPHKRAEMGMVVHTVSPYDDIIRTYAKELGWDWRMLAAIIYQESKFSISSSSRRGAQGLMQIMPQTGLYYGVKDLMNPEQNIIAGSRHLMRMQKQFKREGMTQEELIKFTLAAYNAGEGRISDCISLADAKGIDSMKWDEIVNNVIPMMREDSILEEESVKHGKFQGHETIAYIDSILSHYRAICAIHPEI